MAFIEYLEGAKHAAKNADISDNHHHFQDCGYVLTENDVVVDIDSLNPSIIEKMVAIFNIKTQIVWTERGAHLYFKKPIGFKGSKKVCALGFEVEYKHTKNTKSVTIKRHGEMRKIENEGTREDLPDVLFSTKRFISLVGLDDGEGRNQALFQHRMKINQFTDWQKILNFINDYIFSSPLDAQEFETICRDVKITAGKDNEAEVAEELVKKYKMVFYLGKLYFAHEGAYISDIDILRRVIRAEIGHQKTRYYDEVIKQMEYMSELVSDKVFDIKLDNGILRNGKFIELEYKEFTPFNIDITYKPEAPVNEHVEGYLNHLTNKNPEYRKYLLEILAHCLIVDKEFKRMIGKFFIFVGDGGNGKGTLLSVIRAIVGGKNASGLSMRELKDERYVTTMQGKLCNLGDDIEDMPIDNDIMKKLKNISTCDFISVRDLYKQSREVELTTTLIFTSNHILKSFEKGESFKRRIVWCPMFGKPKTKDKNFISNITSDEALEYWLRLIVEAYVRLYDQQNFSECSVLTDYNNQYHEENNTAIEYLKDYNTSDFINRRSPEVYEEYEIWCNENGSNVQSRKMFVNTLCELFGLQVKAKKVTGKTARVFEQIKVTKSVTDA